MRDVNGKLINVAVIDLERRQGEGLEDYIFAKPGQTESRPKLAYVKRFDPWQLVFTTGVYMDDVERDFNAILFELVAVAVVLIAATAGLVFVVGRNISGGLNRIEDKMNVIAQGEWLIDSSEIDCRDEIGEMAKAVQVFRDNGIRAERLTAEQEAERAAQAKRAATLEALAGDFGRAVLTMLATAAEAAHEMESTAQALSQLQLKPMRRPRSWQRRRGRHSVAIESVRGAREALTRRKAVEMQEPFLVSVCSWRSLTYDCGVISAGSRRAPTTRSTASATARAAHPERNSSW